MVRSKYTIFLFILICSCSIALGSTLDYGRENGMYLGEKAPTDWGWIVNDPYSLIDSYTGPGFWGNARVGEFFLEMYEATGNNSYLEFAKNTASWYENNKINNNGTSWQTTIKIAAQTNYYIYTSFMAPLIKEYCCC